MQLYKKCSVLSRLLVSKCFTFPYDLFLPVNTHVLMTLAYVGNVSIITYLAGIVFSCRLQMKISVPCHILTLNKWQ